MTDLKDSSATAVMNAVVNATGHGTEERQEIPLVTGGDPERPERCEPADRSAR